MPLTCGGIGRRVRCVASEALVRAAATDQGREPRSWRSSVTALGALWARLSRLCMHALWHQSAAESCRGALTATSAAAQPAPA